MSRNDTKVLTTHANTITSALNVELPDLCIITVITCCGDCDFREDASSGTKPVCGHKGILASRPYSNGEKNRAVTRTTIPAWCPLKDKGVKL